MQGLGFPTEIIYFLGQRMVDTKSAFKADFLCVKNLANELLVDKKKMNDILSFQYLWSHCSLST
jgi:hypothetical protein